MTPEAVLLAFMKPVAGKIRHLLMLCHQSSYRGYTIGVEQKGSIWFITIYPKTPDLPILHCYCSKARLQSEADAIAEAKSRVDRALAG
jgi:hypothetical protein